jgi:hypothetical protein
MGCAVFLKKPHLIDFSGIIKASFIIGEYMPAVVSGHFVKGLTASLGQNNGVGRLYGGKIFSAGFPPGAEDVFVGFK